MQTVRRLYLYLMSGIALAVLRRPKTKDAAVPQEAG